MGRKGINIIILAFLFGMGLYHIIPSKFLIGRLIYYISLYGSITGFLFHLRYVSIEKKFKRYYLFASFYSIGKMIYHLWLCAIKYRYDKYVIDYEKSILDYQNGIIEYNEVLKNYDSIIAEYKFEILGIECGLFAAIFTAIVFLILILFEINNNGGLVKK
jgi:hypothetical protein